LKCKALLLAFVLFAAATTLTIAATSICPSYTEGAKATFDFDSLLLDGGIITPCGGGDPVPGPGIPG